ncbi:MAG: SMC-Scp complex subunit ScpB [Dehalococcoidia bacterium]|nr:SMC-Scp complex subunit ScpB [Dehalococcoidia bacterium]
MPRQRKSPVPATTEASLGVASEAPLEDPAPALADGASTPDVEPPTALTGGADDERVEGETPDDDWLADVDTTDTPAREALPTLIEALLFVSDGPVETRTLARGLGVTTRAVTAALEELATRLDGRGLMLQSGPDGAQLVTVPQAAPYVQTFLGLEQNRRLSNAALEALAIIAYRQPVTRATIEAVRGVSSDGAIQTMRARGLIEEAGRALGPGRAALFVTTRRFLEHFGLQGPQDLPPLGDYELPPQDAPMPMGLDLGGAAETAVAQTAVEEVAEALASLSQVARALADPTRRRPGATALLLPGATRLALPSPNGVPSGGTAAPDLGWPTPLPRS